MEGSSALALAGALPAPSAHGFEVAVISRRPGTVNLGKSLLLAGRQQPCLLDPLLALAPAAEAEMLVDPGDLRRIPCGDLVVMEEAEIMQSLFQLGADAADALKIVGLVAARRGKALRPLRPVIASRRPAPLRCPRWPPPRRRRRPSLT